MSSVHPDVERVGSRSPSRVADLLAVWLHPALVLAITVVVLSLHAVWPRLGAGLAWGALVLVLAVGLPMTVLWLALRRGWVSDFHVVRREERLRPLALGIAMVAAGTAIAWAVGVPRDLLALMAAVLAGACVMAVVTLREKISFHAAGVGVALGVLGTAVSGWAWPVAGAALLAVGWARVRAGRHTLPQVVLGALVGAGVVGGLFGLIR